MTAQIPEAEYMNSFFLRKYTSKYATNGKLIENKNSHFLSP
jgi:hypothetical protein